MMKEEREEAGAEAVVGISFSHSGKGKCPFLMLPNPLLDLPFA